MLAEITEPIKPIKGTIKVRTVMQTNDARLFTQPNYNTYLYKVNPSRIIYSRVNIINLIIAKYLMANCKDFLAKNMCFLAFFMDKFTLF